MHFSYTCPGCSTSKNDFDPEILLGVAVFGWLLRHDRSYPASDICDGGEFARFFKKTSNDKFLTQISHKKQKDGSTAAIWSCREDFVAIVVGQAPMSKWFFSLCFICSQAHWGFCLAGCFIHLLSSVFMKIYSEESVDNFTNDGSYSTRCLYQTILDQTRRDHHWGKLFQAFEARLASYQKHPQRERHLRDE